VTNHPQSVEGEQAWSLLRLAQGQLRTAGMGGVISLDMAAVLAMGRALGFDEAALVLLLHYGEAGLVTAFNSRVSEDGGS
jgi:hypothetical protein